MPKFHISFEIKIEGVVEAANEESLLSEFSQNIIAILKSMGARGIQCEIKGDVLPTEGKPFQAAEGGSN